MAESGEVIAVSTETEQILWRTRVDGWPNHLSISLDDRLLYVPLFNTLWMEAIDTRSSTRSSKNSPSASAATARGCLRTANGSTSARCWSTRSPSSISTRSSRSKSSLSKIDVRPFAFLHDESTAYVQLSRLHGFEVVDLRTDKIVREVLLPKLGPEVALPKFYPYTYNHGLELTADEKLLFASGGIGNYVCVYRVPDLALLATIPVGREPNWIAFSQDGKFAYVTNRKSDNVSVIDVGELKEIKRIPVGKYPQRIRTLVVPTRSVAAPTLNGPH